MLSVKDPVPVELRSNVVYKFTCASCNSCYVGETSRHLLAHIREHLNRDRTSHIFQHLQQSEACRSSCSAECFKVIDHATTKFQVEIKEALHISWDQPSLNKQLYHVNLSVDSHKLLGLVLDEVCSKVLRRINLLKAIKIYLPQCERQSFYKPLIQPIIDYACVIWGATSQYNLDRIIRLQKYAARVILNIKHPQDVPSSELFYKLN